MTEKELSQLKEELKRCSPATLAAAIRFRDQGDLESIPTIVLGVLEHYQPSTSNVRISDAPPEARLIEDLGLDSLTLLEVVMTLEQVLNMTIPNEELRDLGTMGRLNQFLRDKISGQETSSEVRHYDRDRIILRLPQQPPFLFLDSATLEGSNLTGTYTVRGDESCLEGHFPDYPVFPAALVFEALGQAACLALLETRPDPASDPDASDDNRVFFAGLDGARFHAVVRPGDCLQLHVELEKLREPLAIYRGRVTRGEQTVAQVRRLMLAFGVSPLPPAEADQGAAHEIPPVSVSYTDPTASS